MNKYLYTDIETIAAQNEYHAFERVYRVHKRSAVKKWTVGILITLVIILFLPWTQNIRARGNITTLRPEQRPQQVNNVISGALVKWYVKEGDYVKQGDTILQLGEVKAEYFDPKLLERTQQQIQSKTISAEGYKNKAITATAQVDALMQARNLKLDQIDIKQKQQALKVQSDSIDLIAAVNEMNVAKRQIGAAEQMLDSGVLSLIDFERRKVIFQNAQAKRISAENKLLQSKQELVNLAIERNATIQDYADKISKTAGERFASLSGAASTEAEIAKLENAYASYDIRNKLYYVLAPQSGQIIQTKKAGIGEVVKEGDLIAEIVPDQFQYAVEMFINPMDQPLVSTGQPVRFVFDGFPAIVFSGWPEASYGTFGGKIIAVENNANSEGKFRVLVVEDSTEKPWPPQLRLGGGANGIALLKDVAIWYELWRNINGFPPEYYRATSAGPAKK